ncbi:MAG TPA: S-methyl-5-thioribose-1-phosphate isomerase [Gemmatimonadales bacterium]|nr:S-methyl-5-thioribose-1-phosphate isomerase [Gemmatimonadales bacterium]
MSPHPLGWTPERRLALLDQTLLPGEERWITVDTVDGVVEAIATLRVRGAPAIGIAAAMGLVASLRARATAGREAFLATVQRDAATIGAARPTAVNLSWAMTRMVERARAARGDAGAVLAALEEEAQAIWDEDRECCRLIAEHGLKLVAGCAEARLRRSRGTGDGVGVGDVVNVLTHCNTGFLATGGVGTALGIVHLAAEQGRRVHVWVDETRPLLQGSRLTAWELGKAGIPHTVVADGVAASVMAAGRVDVVLVGADRIAANGDAANKAGTYALAVAARHHAVPFYVVAPSSSFDPACRSGDAIPIEQRPGTEVTRVLGRPAAPEQSPAYNPAFDVTPAALIAGWVTERGILQPPF